MVPGRSNSGHIGLRLCCRVMSVVCVFGGVCRVRPNRGFSKLGAFSRSTRIAYDCIMSRGIIVIALGFLIHGMPTETWIQAIPAGQH